MNAPTLVADYREDPVLKQAFFEFTPRALYGASFVEWDRLGFWSPKYVPYSLVLNDPEPRIIANVSISRMRVLLRDRPVRAIQFATVGTLPEFQRRGYADRLMRHVLETESYELCFLFGNESVVEFYPRFGFRRIREALFFRGFEAAPGEARTNPEAPEARRLNLHDAADLALFKSLLGTRAPITGRVGALDYEHILPFYAVYAFGEDLFYFEGEHPALIVAQNEGPIFNVYDIVCRPAGLDPARIQRMLRGIAADGTREICYHFTPELIDPNAQARDFDDSDSPLFVRGDFPDAELRPFKFPALAQT
ncbi:MAG: GNAT family N-acetyltransferase [Leptospirales bacterium]|jgi:GNAT superfamily N-acetyltransferase